MIKKKFLPNFETCKTSFNFDICHVSPIFTNTSMFHILTIRNSKFPTPWTILWSFDVSWYIIFEPLAMFYHVSNASCVWHSCIFILLFKGIMKRFPNLFDHQDHIARTMCKWFNYRKFWWWIGMDAIKKISYLTRCKTQFGNTIFLVQLFTLL
jgi:hypothetical protein